MRRVGALKFNAGYDNLVGKNFGFSLIRITRNTIQMMSLRRITERNNDVTEKVEYRL